MREREAVRVCDESGITRPVEGAREKKGNLLPLHGPIALPPPAISSPPPASQAASPLRPCHTDGDYAVGIRHVFVGGEGVR